VDKHKYRERQMSAIRDSVLDDFNNFLAATGSVCGVGLIELLSVFDLGDFRRKFLMTISKIW
jgi:hypothetical protein